MKKAVVKFLKKDWLLEKAADSIFWFLVLPITVVIMMFIMTPVLLLWKKLGLETK